MGQQTKTGLLKYYVDLQVQTGTKRTNMRFFLTDMGDQQSDPWLPMVRREPTQRSIGCEDGLT